MTGAITEQIDAVQLLVAAFFVFFAGLVLYLRREDKREGYPVIDTAPRRGPVDGFPSAPPSRRYLLLDGGETEMPHREAPSRTAAVPVLRFPGAPLVPVGDPMRAEVGPGAFPLRKDEPFMAFGHPQVRPLREASDWKVVEGDADPRGLPVVDARHRTVGTVRDLWVDRGVRILRYLEVELETGPAGGGRALLPAYYADVKRRRGFVRVRALLAHEFAGIPRLAGPDHVTAREEDRVNAYFASAPMYGRGRQGGLMLPTEQSGPGASR